MPRRRRLGALVAAAVLVAVSAPARFSDAPHGTLARVGAFQDSVASSGPAGLVARGLPHAAPAILPAGTPAGLRLVQWSSAAEAAAAAASQLAGDAAASRAPPLAVPTAA